jgi:hypothetical protein
VRAAQTTAAGTGADTRVVRKDASAPPEPLITSPANGTVTTNNTPPISGTAEPGATVSVYVKGNLVGTTVANAMGQWTFTPPTPIADGTYAATASARDASGNESGRGAGPTFTIDSVAPMAPVITSPETNATVDDDRTLDVAGVAEALSTVTVYVDGRAVGTTTADATGRFTYELDPSELGDGAHVLEADARDAAGNTSPKSAAVNITIRKVDARFAGQGVVGCSTAGGLELLGLALLLRRRRGAEVRS